MDELLPAPFRAQIDALRHMSGLGYATGALITHDRLAGDEVSWVGTLT